MDKRKVILIVDDEPAITLSLSFCLEQEGYRVLMAESGQKAVEIVVNDVPDLIISDVMMPEMDGFEFCRRIREYYKTRQIPFLFLSAMSTRESQEFGMQMGGTDFIPKPFNVSELVLKVRAILREQEVTPGVNR